MTREEAIEWFETHMPTKLMPVAKKAYEMAISALKYPQGEWISVKDRLPKTGTVLATDGKVVITAPSPSVTLGGVITHWMPLPEPPKNRG